MNLEQFEKEPWKTSHRAYDDSPFNIRPAPEYANSEVIVSSLYRALGFPSCKEAIIPKAGRDFDKKCQDRRKLERAGLMVSADTWRTILLGVLESPRLPNQSSKRFLQLSPVVPDVALYAGSARLAGNPWNPGALVQRVVTSGATDSSHARSVWCRLFDGLSVSSSDDLWARWLQGEFERLREEESSWEFQDLPGDASLAPPGSAWKFPARQLVKDLEAVVAAKPYMTRRQWISLLEAILRLGCVTHVFWLCSVNDRIWRALRDAIEGKDLPAEAANVDANVVFANTAFLVYGNPAVPIIRDLASRFLNARLGINLVLWALEETNVYAGTLSNSDDLLALLRTVHEHRSTGIMPSVMARFQRLLDENARTMVCKKGIGSNLVEFGRHALGQRQTASEVLRGYDQGYLLRKKGEHAAAPWVVSLGPVAVLALVHCCLHEIAGPRSIQRLCEHLECYGVEVDRDDIAKSDLGRKLRMLGLVLDSPDAESGMLLVPPFGTGF